MINYLFILIIKVFLRQNRIIFISWTLLSIRTANKMTVGRKFENMKIWYKMIPFVIEYIILNMLFKNFHKQYDQAMSCIFSASWTSLGFLSWSSFLWSSLLSLIVFLDDMPASISSASSWCLALSELALTAEYSSIIAWILLIFSLLTKNIKMAITTIARMAREAPIKG